MHNIKIAQTTISISIVLIISAVTGFLRDVALAYAYGTSVESDAFVLSQSVLSVFSALLFVALGIAFIPVFSKLKVKDNNAELNSFIDSTYSVAGTIIIFVCIIGIIGADIIVYLLAPGFTNEAHKLGVSLTRILLPTILCSFISTIEVQQLRGNNIFMPPAFLGYPLNIVLIIGFTFLTPFWGIEGAAFAYVLGTMLQVAMFYPSIKKLGYKFHYHFDLHNRGLHEILILTLPIMIGNTIQTINTIVDRILASGLAEGSIAALNYSNKLAIFIVGVISLGAGTVCYTKMSELSARNEFYELKIFLRNIINLLNLIVVPASIGMMALNTPIIKLVFGYGAFDSKSCEMASITLWFYSIGLVAFVLRDIITRAFYALNDSKTPMINGGIAVSIGIVANILLVNFLGIGGLALATSISGIIGTLLLLVSLRKKMGHIGLKEIGTTFFKACIAGIIMGISVHYLYTILYRATGILWVSLILGILCGTIIYSMLIFLMKIKEVDFLLRYLKVSIS